LPPERRFVPSPGLAIALRQMMRHLRNLQLMAAYAVGFGVLFGFLAVFTYVNFHLAAPPYRLSASFLGAIFVAYLAGSVVTPMAGMAAGRLGRRNVVIAAIGLWVGGLLLTLAPPLWLIIAGLTVAAMCGFMCQTISTSFVATTAREGASAAIGVDAAGHVWG